MNIDEIIDTVIMLEGGYTDNHADHGGTTKYGVTRDTFSDYLRTCGLADRAVEECTRDMAVEIYKERYFGSPQLNLPKILSWKIQLSIFDAAVNRGPARAARMAQHVLNRMMVSVPDIPEDGIIGLKTLQLLNSIDTEIFIREFRHLGIIMYVDIALSDRTQTTFLKGWINRLHIIEDILSESPMPPTS